MTNELTADDLVWAAPGPGRWEGERAHADASCTPIVQHLMATGMQRGLRTVFIKFGVPLETMDARFVNGQLYTRLRPLIGADKVKPKAPPAWVLKLAFRLHPELRRRAKRAKFVLATQPWRETVRAWHTTTRPRLEAENLALQDVDLGALDDAALAAHVGRALAHAEATWELHFVLHGDDLGPIGLLLVRCREWGIAAEDVLPALRDASPSTSEPARVLSRLRAAAAACPTPPRSLDELRAASPEAAAELDHYLRLKGAHVVSRYDLDGLTLGELPEVVLGSVLAGAEPRTGNPEASAAALRARVPAADRAEFDDLLTEARFAMDLRDDNGPHTVEWTLGLLRLGLLEAGRRAAALGRVHQAEHVFDLEPGELAAFIAAAAGPTADELATRAARREALATVVPPRFLGEPEAVPPPSVMPAAVARLADVTQTVVGLLTRQEAPDPLAGTGVGDQPYVGRVRRAVSAEEAVATLEPGDVLVVPYTTPAYNVVLPLAGAIVTVEGGPLSHAAVLARELGLPAVVGVAGALALPDGALVEVDPTAGRVSVVDRAPATTAPATTA